MSLSGPTHRIWEDQDFKGSLGASSPPIVHQPPISYTRPMLTRPRALPAGFIAPCLPINAPQPPSGAQWLHEIKHDGFRVIARKGGPRVKLYSRPGNDLTKRFLPIVEALARLRARSCIVDGEAVCAVMTASPPSTASAIAAMTPAPSCTPSI
jgi:ATP-dependent DNA ligase